MKFLRLFNVTKNRLMGFIGKETKKKNKVYD